MGRSSAWPSQAFQVFHVFQGDVGDLFRSELLWPGLFLDTTGRRLREWQADTQRAPCE